MGVEGEEIKLVDSRMVKVGSEEEREGGKG